MKKERVISKLTIVLIVFTIIGTMGHAYDYNYYIDDELDEHASEDHVNYNDLVFILLLASILSWKVDKLYAKKNYKSK
jgi:hypothetical protein